MKDIFKDPKVYAAELIENFDGDARAAHAAFKDWYGINKWQSGPRRSWSK